MSKFLMPPNSTPWERAMAAAMEPSSISTGSIVTIRGTKIASPPPSFLPFLIWEYGLSELTPYVPNLYDLIDEGIDWQRVRGTLDAVARGLAWLGYTADVEEALSFRRFWNSFQLRFSSLPVNDAPDLERIEGVTTLSVPIRSKLRRGVHFYDVTALEADHSRLDNAMLDFSSGIVTTPKGTIWSFGRAHEIEHTLSEAEGTALGMWVPEVEGGGLTWEDMTFPWLDANFAWNADPATARAIAMASWFEGQRIYIALKDAEANVIGYRRARAVHVVKTEFEGAYQFDGADYGPNASGSRVYVEALTQFDDAHDVTAQSVSLVVAPDLSEGVKPGKLWLEPEDCSGGVEIAVSAVEIPLRTTVREQIKFMLRF